MAKDFFLEGTYNQLSKLQFLSSSLLQARTLSEVGSIILDKGSEALGATSGDLVILDKSGKTFNILSYKGYGKHIADEFEDLPREVPLLTNYVVITKKPYFLKNVDLLGEEFSFAKEVMASINSKSAALLPLRVTNKTVGVLEFIFKDVQTFSATKKRFMLHLADQCAQALDKIIALENEKKAKAELDTILRRIDNGVIVRNAQGAITYANSAALDMHGMENPKELLNLSLEKYFALFSKVTDEKGNEISLSKIPFIEVFKEKRPIKNTFFKIVKKTNEGHWLEITSVPVFNKKNTIEVVISVMHDITEQKQNENSKNEFFAIVSHEIKTPVTTLKAYTQVLEKRFEKDKNQAAIILKKMDFQVDKLTNLIKDFLDIAKIEGGKMQFSEEKFELNSLIKELIDEIQLTFDSHKIFFNKTKKIIIFGDRERIGQVIINFLTNAVKYSPESSKIIVEMQKNNKEIVFSVQDFGIGISRKDQKFVFERFYREKSLKASTFPGLGLGLYIAAEIIKRQHGKIWVKSSKGKGSTFFFSLPL